MALAISVGLKPSFFLAAVSFLGVIGRYCRLTAPERLPDGLLEGSGALISVGSFPSQHLIEALPLRGIASIMDFPVSRQCRPALAVG